MPLPTPTAPLPTTRRPLAKRPWFWALLGLIGLIVVIGIMFTAAVPLSSDTLRHRIIETLSEKLDSDVELGDLHLRVFPGLRADGVDLRIRRRGMGDYPPLIAIKSFHVDANLLGLWRKHVEHVQLDGLDINIPPSEARDRQKKLEKSEVKNQKSEAKSDDKKPEETVADVVQDPLKAGGVIIDRTDTNDARLLILPLERTRNEVWAIHHLHDDLGSPQPWPFKATLTNGVPPGEIDVEASSASGIATSPATRRSKAASTSPRPILSVFKGSRARCRRRGYFGGTLSQINANGAPTRPTSPSRPAGIRFRCT